MTVLAFPKSVAAGVIVFRQTFRRLIDALSPQERRWVAVAFSLLLHIGILLLMLPSPRGFLSIGTDGLGDVNGAGVAVTLVDVSNISPQGAVPVPVEMTADEQAKTEVLAVEAEIAGAEALPEPAEVAERFKEQVAKHQERPVSTDSQERLDSATQAAAGAFGQNGEAYTDLWNAIAPCWSRIADIKTLPATLTISFDDGGEVSAPPIIQRDPAAPITDDSLRAEAKALQALAECGAYPMAKSLPGVTVKFPAPGQLSETDTERLPTALAIRP